MSFVDGKIRQEISEFLTTRRARITPQAAGLPNYGGNRRVAGLRREEVAMLAGVSVDYYTRIERGNIDGVSDSVLNAIMRVLNLNDVEQKYLRNLALLGAGSRVKERKPAATSVRPGLIRLIDSMPGSPAYIRDNKLGILAANSLAAELFAVMGDLNSGHVNLARFFFLDPRAPEFFVDWEKIAGDTVGVLRAKASKDPFDRALTDLIGELCTRSELFAAKWANHNVYEHKLGTKRFNHPEVGLIELYFEGLELPTDPGLSVVTYLAEANTPAADSLKLLAMKVNAIVN
jgi:transcriptional regulator with XRE-family HTH domain